MSKAIRWDIYILYNFAYFYFPVGVFILYSYLFNRLNIIFLIHWIIYIYFLLRANPYAAFVLLFISWTILHQRLQWVFDYDTLLFVRRISDSVNGKTSWWSLLGHFWHSLIFYRPFPPFFHSSLPVLPCSIANPMGFFQSLSHNWTQSIVTSSCMCGFCLFVFIMMGPQTCSRRTQSSWNWKSSIRLEPCLLLQSKVSCALLISRVFCKRPNLRSFPTLLKATHPSLPLPHVVDSAMGHLHATPSLLSNLLFLAGIQALPAEIAQSSHKSPRLKLLPQSNACTALLLLTVRCTMSSSLSAAVPWISALDWITFTPTTTPWTHLPYWTTCLKTFRSSRRIVKFLETNRIVVL